MSNKIVNIPFLDSFSHLNGNSDVDTFTPDSGYKSCLSISVR